MSAAQSTRKRTLVDDSDDEEISSIEDGIQKISTLLSPHVHQLLKKKGIPDHLHQRIIQGIAEPKQKIHKVSELVNVRTYQPKCKQTKKYSCRNFDDESDSDYNPESDDDELFN